VVGAFAPDFVAFTWFGLLPQGLIPPAYRVGLNALPLLLFAFTAFGAYIQLSIWFKRSGQVRYGLLFAAVGAGVTLGVNVLLIPVFGFLGSALATLCCYTVMAMLAYFTGQALAPIPYKWGALLVYAVAAAVTLAANEALHDVPLEALWRLLLVGGYLGAVVGLERRRLRLAQTTTSPSATAPKAEAPESAD
jgi:Membrane protein involved in the export of O-antigen and teichoic acid